MIDSKSALAIITIVSRNIIGIFVISDAMLLVIFAATSLADNLSYCICIMDMRLP